MDTEDQINSPYFFLGLQSVSLYRQSWSSVRLAFPPVASAALWEERNSDTFRKQKKVLSNIVKNLHFFQDINKDSSKEQAFLNVILNIVLTHIHNCSVKHPPGLLLCTWYPLWVFWGGDLIPQSLQLIMQVYHVQNWLSETEQTSLQSLYFWNKLSSNWHRSCKMERFHL